MELNVNSPAYFTQQFGVDDEVYRMCRETREFLQDKEYSEVLQVIGILPVAAPEELFENGTWSEQVRFLNHQAVAAVRVKLDYERYRDGSSTTRVHMMREAILQAGKRVKTRGSLLTVTLSGICTSSGATALFRWLAAFTHVCGRTWEIWGLSGAGGGPGQRALCGAGLPG